MARGDSTFIGSQTFLFTSEYINCRYPAIARAIGDVYAGFGQYEGTDGFMRAFRMSSTGTPYGLLLDAPTEFNTNNSGYHSALRVEEGLVFVLAGPYAGSGAGYAFTFSVDLLGNIVEIDQVNFASYWRWMHTIPLEGVDRIFLSAGASDSNRGTLMTFTIGSAGEITDNTPLEYYNQAITESRVCHLVDDLYVVIYQTGSSSAYCDIRTFRVSDTGVISDLGDPITLDETFGVGYNTHPGICRVNDEMVAIVLSTVATTAGVMITVEINSTTGVVTDEVIDLLAFNDDLFYNDILTLGNDLFVIGFNENGNGNTAKVYTFDITSAGEITLLDPMTNDGSIGAATEGDPVWMEVLPDTLTIGWTIHSVIALTYRTGSKSLATRTFYVDTAIPAEFVCTDSAGIHNFTAQMLGDATGTLLQWDLGRSCPTCSGSSAATCKVTIQYSTDGTPHQAPNTPPYVVRDMIQSQCTQRALWHPNTTHTNHYYSAWVYYDTFNRWIGPYNPSVTPTLPAALGSIEPFHSGSLSYTKLGTNTKLAARQDIMSDVIVWLPESQDGRAPAIEAAMQAISPAHTKLNVMYERYYVAQTTTDQFNESDIDITVYDIRNGIIVNKKATIDSSYGGQADILGD